MSIPMGIGTLGNFNPPRKRFRWTFEGFDEKNKQVFPAHFVKLTARPEITIEETFISTGCQTAWIPGKSAWSEITINLYDIDVKGSELYNRISQQMEWDHTQGKRCPTFTGILRLYDGCGGILEGWKLEHCFFKSVKFDGGYSPSDVGDMEMVITYKSVEYATGQKATSKEWMMEASKLPLRRLLGLIT